MYLIYHNIHKLIILASNLNSTQDYMLSDYEPNKIYHCET